ncbi:MAG: hypothetical protein BAJATHORv1_50046 [Candidatus Thorarchaeota archaeon]|nr:MAG: hypothetical protein BAJATHORv1_50046 [Candidatus Thorarchaeota archaeon]
MSKSEKEVYVFCEQCKKNVLLRVPLDSDAATRGGLMSVVSVHGDPPHALMAYLDAQFRVRGVEYPAAAQTGDTGKIESVPESKVEQLEEKVELGIPALLGMLHSKQKDAIKALSIIMVNLLTKKRIFLIHDEEQIGSSVISALHDIVSSQEELITLISHEILSQSDLNPFCVYDLQQTKFIHKGPKIDSKYFERTLDDITKHENPYFRLKNEMSKIVYAFEKLQEILSSLSSPILDTKLAMDASIDYELMPFLLELAESEGIVVRSLVQKDGLGRALRSI